MKLSIIIPVYNTAEYLPACLDSVIYPELGEYEVIIVNDGSKDASPEIAQSYAEKYPELVRLINKENGGLGDARNHGTKSAKGEYIFFLDSDDRLAPNAVPEIMDTLQDEPDLLIFNLQQLNTDGKFLCCIHGAEKEGILSLDNYPELIFQPHAACNKIVRRSMLFEHDIFFPARIWYEDLHTSPKYYVYAKKIIYVNKNWYYYLMRTGSITNNPNTGRNLEIISAVDAALDFYRKAGMFEKYAKQLEFLAFYNQFLTTSTRVCLADWRSPVLIELQENFISKFPDYRNNPYICSMSKKYRLLTFLLERKSWLSVHLIMKANTILKSKKV